MNNLDPKLLPLLGEYAWHSLTVDPQLQFVSKDHYQRVRQIISEQFADRPASSLKILEVACYAHTTGYDLARELGCDVTLFELSAATLRLGRSLAAPAARPPRLVIGDFHQLPFVDGEFDFVFICSALHHTYDYARVARELIRVVAPGGILFLENEPCLREACFYRFRCNREASFTPLEQHLWDAGWLRTIAEPYVGSRPETLFGMIENQRMPLPELLSLFGEAGEVCGREVYPEICMGNREFAWFNAREDDNGKLTQMIREDLTAALDAAVPFVGDVERGLGFSLPDRSEIPAFAEKIAVRLHALSGSPGSPEFRGGLAALFGAAIRLTIRRSNKIVSTGDHHIPPMTPEPDGILNGFPTQAKRLLGQKSMLPDLQNDDPAQIASVFPVEMWRYGMNDNKIGNVCPTRNNCAIELPQLTGESLFVLRLYTGLPANGAFYEVLLCTQEAVLARCSVFHPESQLLVTTLPPSAQRLRLEFRSIPGGDPLQAPPPLSVSVVGLFRTDVTA